MKMWVALFLVDLPLTRRYQRGLRPKAKRNPRTTNTHTMRILTCLIILLQACWLQATTYHWIGGEAGNFTTSSNWSPSGVPSFGDSAVVNLDGLTGGGTGITLNSTRTLQHMTFTGSCPLPFRLGGGSFTGIHIEDGAFLMVPGLDVDELKLQFRGGNSRLRSAGNQLQNCTANNDARVTLEDDLDALEQIEYINAVLDLNGHNVSAISLLITRSFTQDTVLTRVGDAQITMRPGAFGGRQVSLLGEFDLEDAIIDAEGFSVDGRGSLGNATIHCDRFYVSPVGLAATTFDPGTSTVYLTYREGGTSTDDERVDVRGGRLNRLVVQADSFVAMAIYADTIQELILETGVQMDRLVMRDSRFGSGFLYVDQLTLEEGIRVEAPFSFDVKLNLGSGDVCTDQVTFRNFGVNGSGTYRAGSASLDLGGNTSWLFTDCSPPVLCGTPPTGLLASAGPSGVNLSWAALPDALAYRVRGRPLGTTTWRFLPGLIPTSPSPTALVPAGALVIGSYEWEVVAACTPDYSVRSPFSATASFFWPGARLSQDAATRVTVYPNPATTAIVLEGLSAEAQLRIIDVTGRLHWSGTAPNSTLKIDVSNWSSGVYVAKVGDGTPLRFVVQH